MKLKPASILNLTKKIGIFWCIWPLDPNATFVTKLIHEIKRFLLVMNEVAFLVPLILCANNNFRKNNSPKAVHALAYSATHINNILNLFIWWLQRKQIQMLLRDASEYIMNLKDDKRDILELYFNRYFSLHAFVSASCIGTTIVYSFSPLMLPQIFVTDALEYPFEVPTLSVLHIAIYIEQLIVITQVGMMTLLEIAINTILLTIVTTKLQVLVLDIQEATNENQLKNCLQQHQNVIRYAKRVDHVMRFMILKYYIFIAATGMFAAIQLLFPKSFFHVLGILLYSTTCLLGLYPVAWAADDMYSTSMNISLAVYNSNWIDCSPKVRKMMVTMMARAKRPLDISVNGILPALTLEFFAQLILFICSYFMTIRALVTRT